MLEKIVVSFTFDTGGLGQGVALEFLSFLLLLSTILVNEFRFREPFDLDSNLWNKHDSSRVVLITFIAKDWTMHKWLCLKILNKINVKILADFMTCLQLCQLFALGRDFFFICYKFILGASRITFFHNWSGCGSVHFLADWVFLFPRLICLQPKLTLFLHLSVDPPHWGGLPGGWRLRKDVEDETRRYCQRSWYIKL